jgi:hypothetical protein
MGIEHICIICAVISGWIIRGNYDKTQRRLEEVKSSMKAVGAELERRGVGPAPLKIAAPRPTEQSFYDEDLTQCIYDAAKKAGVMDEEKEQDVC